MRIYYVAQPYTRYLEVTGTRGAKINAESEQEARKMIEDDLVSWEMDDEFTETRRETKREYGPLDFVDM
jgi:hypothetical protein